MQQGQEGSCAEALSLLRHELQRAQIGTEHILQHVLLMVRMQTRGRGVLDGADKELDHRLAHFGVLGQERHREDLHEGVEHTHRGRKRARQQQLWVLGPDDGRIVENDAWRGGQTLVLALLLLTPWAKHAIGRLVQRGTEGRCRSATRELARSPLEQLVVRGTASAL